MTKKPTRLPRFIRIPRKYLFQLLHSHSLTENVGVRTKRKPQPTYVIRDDELGLLTAEIRNILRLDGKTHKYV